jgi:hypothetical protein
MVSTTTGYDVIVVGLGGMGSAKRQYGVEHTVPTHSDPLAAMVAYAYDQIDQARQN